MDLIILAGGLGSRFGGDKQIQEIDENGNFIMDYSIFDAIDIGFDKIVVVVKEKLFSFVKERYEKRLGNKAKLEVVIQNNDVLKRYGIEREKPLGTAHALLCVKDVVDDKFCMINADDFYGKNSFKKAYLFLKNVDINSIDFGNVCFSLEKTLSDNGSVKRGICKLKNSYITQINEYEIGIKNNKIIANNFYNSKKIVLNGNCLVSMNMFCFTPRIFEYLEKYFDEFCEMFKTCSNKDCFLDKEYSLPDVINKIVSNDFATLKVCKTTDDWIGITYKEDLQIAKNNISNLLKNRVYPKDLW